MEQVLTVFSQSLNVGEVLNVFHGIITICVSLPLCGLQCHISCGRSSEESQDVMFVCVTVSYFASSWIRLCLPNQTKQN